VKKYILSIELETKEYFEQFISEILGKIDKDKSILPNEDVNECTDSFLNNFISLLDYYVEGIYYSGKLVSRKKLNLQNPVPPEGERYYFTDNDKEFIKKYKYLKLPLLKENLKKALVDYINHNCNKENINEKSFNLFEEFFEYNVMEIIDLFKRAQIEEYSNLNIDKIRFLSDEDNCCILCSSKSNKVYTLESIKSEFGIKDGLKHSFCKFSFEPVSSNLFTNINYKNVEFENIPIEYLSRAKNVIDKLKLVFTNINNKKIIFINDSNDDSNWKDSIIEYYVSKNENDLNQINDNIINSIVNDIQIFNKNQNESFVYLSNINYQDIEYLILKSILFDIDIEDLVVSIFNNKKESKEVGGNAAIYKDLFISYLAEESPKSYLIESIIFYIYKPNRLKIIDREIFNYIEQNKTKIGEKLI